MGRGTKYPFVENILKLHTTPSSRVLEIGAGGAVYRSIFGDYFGTDLAGNPYAEKGDLVAFCDAQNIPFGEGTFDLAFMVAVFYQVPDPARAIKELRRVLKPGGTLLLFDYNKKRTSRLKKTEHGGANANHVWSPGDLNKLAELNGFRASIINHHEHFPTTGSSLKDGIRRTGIYLAMKNVISEDWCVLKAVKAGEIDGK